MKQRIGLTPLLACFLFIVFLGVSTSTVAHSDQSRAISFVEALADRAIGELTDPNVPPDEQERRFRTLINENVAVKSIARWVLGGRVWRRASDDQKERYLTLFGDLMVATYAHRFKDYAGETLDVQSAQRIDDIQTLVRTTMARPGADRAIKVDWRVRETKGQHRVIDVMVEGLSLAQTQRSEFASYLREHNQNVDALIANLEERLHDVRTGRTAEAAEKQ